MCRVIIIPGGACRPSFESQSKKVTRLMYSDSVDGRLSNKVLGVHLCRPFEISAGLLDRLLFPFPLEAALPRPRKYAFRSVIAATRSRSNN